MSEHSETSNIKCLCASSARRPSCWSTWQRRGSTSARSSRKPSRRTTTSSRTPRRSWSRRWKSTRRTGRPCWRPWWRGCRRRYRPPIHSLYTTVGRVYQTFQTTPLILSHFSDPLSLILTRTGLLISIIECYHGYRWSFEYHEPWSVVMNIKGTFRPLLEPSLRRSPATALINALIFMDANGSDVTVSVCLAG